MAILDARDGEEGELAQHWQFPGRDINTSSVAGEGAEPRRVLRGSLSTHIQKSSDSDSPLPSRSAFQPLHRETAQPAQTKVD